MKRLLTYLVLALVCSTATLGCQALSGLLPVIGDIIGNIVRAKEALNKVDSIAGAYFAVSPNQEMQKKYAKAHGIAENSLTGVMKVAQGAESAAQEDIDAAWDEFRQGYTALIVVLADIGFRVQFDGEDTLQAGGQEGMPLMAIPSPDSLRDAS